MAAAPRKPKVTVLAGFLGSGKTTVLNSLLRVADHRFALIVNDFGSIPIDAHLTSGITGVEHEVSLPSGCICCTVRGDLLQAIVGLCARDTPPEHILVECSGVSDPFSVVETFAMPGVHDIAELNTVVVTLDGEQFESLTGGAKKLASRQLGAADIVLLTKADLLPAEVIQRARDEVLRQVPHARLLTIRHGAVPPALVLGEEPGATRAAATPNEAQSARVGLREASDPQSASKPLDHDVEFARWHFTADEPLRLGAVRRLIRRLPRSVYRAKGVLWTTHDATRPVVVHVVGRRAELSYGEPWSSPPRTEFVALGDPGTMDAQTLEEGWSACLASRAASTGLRGLLGRFMRDGAA